MIKDIPQRIPDKIQKVLDIPFNWQESEAYFLGQNDKLLIFHMEYRRLSKRVLSEPHNLLGTYPYLLG